jgi:hypothetical protein
VISELVDEWLRQFHLAGQQHHRLCSRDLAAGRRVLRPECSKPPRSGLKPTRPSLPARLRHAGRWAGFQGSSSRCCCWRPMGGCVGTLPDDPWSVHWFRHGKTPDIAASRATSGRGFTFIQPLDVTPDCRLQSLASRCDPALVSLAR